MLDDGKIEDIDVPLVACKTKNEYSGGWSQDATHWCPKYDPKLHKLAG